MKCFDGMTNLRDVNCIFFSFPSASKDKRERKVVSATITRSSESFNNVENTGLCLNMYFLFKYE